jgi:predicted permease
MGSLLQDLRFAARSFVRTPGFTLVMIVSIALGIAANTTVFSILNGLLLGRLPVSDPDRLVVFSNGNTFSYLDYQDYRDQSKPVFEDVAVHFPLVPASIAGTGEPERLWGQLASANYFRVVGVNPFLGRGFLPEEDTVFGRDPVVVLSYGLWQRRFGRDSMVVGRQISMNGAPYTVVGVMPAGFHGTDRALLPDFWVPVAMYRQILPDLAIDNLHEKRDAQWLILNARLRPGVSRETAVTAVNVITQRINREYKKGNTIAARPAITLDDAGGLPGGLNVFVGNLMLFLMVVVGLVLMVACANVANLLLARATSRRKEIGIRLAIGANRGRLIRQLLTESVFLATLGASLGSAITWIAAAALSKIQLPFPIPVSFNFVPGGLVLGFTAGLAILTGIVFGLTPALRATRPDLVTSLKDLGGGFSRLRQFGLRNGLVAAQVALSFVLLAGAVLFLRSLQNAGSVDIGFRPQNVALMAVDPKLNGYTPERTKQFVAQLRERVQSIPGVQSVSFLDSVPLSLGGTSDGFETMDTPGGVRKTGTDLYTVGSRFFETFGIPILRGRDFQLTRDGRNVVIISQTMSRKLFGEENAVGRRLKSDGKIYEVIGMARDAKSRMIGEGPKSVAYFFLEPEPSKVVSFFGISVVVKTSGNPASVFPAVREQIRWLDPKLAVFNQETMQQHVNNALLIPRVCALLLGVFGTIGLSLAVIGLYAVMSYLVRSQTREIGIRMALGAGAGSVLWSTARRGVALAGAGLAIGCALALATGRFAEAFLLGVNGHDLLTFVIVPVVLLAAAGVAVLVPARRAARVDPIRALRYE